jgi:hypothetical protein
VDGEPVETGSGSASISVDAGAGAASLRYLSLAMRNAESGTVYFDEFHWREPELQAGFTARGEVSWSLSETILEYRSWPVLANVDLRQELSVTTAGFAAATSAPTATVSVDGGAPSAEGAQLRSETAVGADVAGARLETDLSVSTRTTELTDAVLRAGHRLRIPAGDAPVSFRDEFRRSFGSSRDSLFRKNQLSLSVPVVEAAVSTEAQRSGGELGQRWGGTLTGPWDPYRLESELSLAETAESFDIPETGYFGSWMQGYTLVAPYREARVSQLTADMRLSGSRSGDPLSVETEARLGFANGGERRLEQNDTGSLTLAFPLTFRSGDPREWSLTPRLGRSFSHTVPRAADARFTAGFDTLFGDLEERPYPLQTVPIAELFSARAWDLFVANTEGLGAASYTPSVSLGLQRPSGSRLVHLFVPSSAELGFERPLSREGDAVQDRRRVSVQATAQALNLFGRQGAYPVFSFYQSDEFTNELSFSVERNRTSDELSLDTSLRNLVRLFGREHREAELESNVAYAWDGEPDYSLATAFRYQWRTQIAEDPIIGVLNAAREAEGYYSHTERLRINTEALGLGRPESAVTVVLGHESALEIPERGSIRVYGDFGIGREQGRSSESEQTILGVQAGIEGVLEF